MLQLALVTVGEVDRLLHQLPMKTSPLDCLPTPLLKECAPVMAPLLTRLANLSFSESVFPARYKVGRYTPAEETRAAIRRKSAVIKPQRETLQREDA